MNKRTRVALIFGGQSSEHSISCLTAAGVFKAIDPQRFDVVGVGISRSGRWTQVPLDVVGGYRIVDGVAPEVDEVGSTKSVLDGAHVNHADDIRKQRCKIVRHRRNFQFVGVDLRKIQNVVDDRQKGSRGAR